MICSLILITECVQKAVEKRIRSKDIAGETSASSNRSECENNETGHCTSPKKRGRSNTKQQGKNWITRKFTKEAGILIVTFS